jgi:hypothetical protein
MNIEEQEGSEDSFEKEQTEQLELTNDELEEMQKILSVQDKTIVKPQWVKTSF